MTRQAALEKTESKNPDATVILSFLPYLESFRKELNDVDDELSNKVRICFLTSRNIGQLLRSNQSTRVSRPCTDKRCATCSVMLTGDIH
ncbi:hypothetical protein GJ496_010694 [Pomphorhynchus laevis]|nr:hypothetical protein GJ496_010694 [Pomphorhynchus laevis]